MKTLIGLLAPRARQSEALADAFERIRPHLIFAAIFSFAVNLLYLASPLYMLQVYDRVLSSGNMATLVFITIVLLAALVVLASLDAIRNRVLILAGEELDASIAERLLTRLMHLPDDGARSRSAVLREFDAFRTFISGPGAQLILDGPWAPIFIVVCALLHPWIGLLALAGTGMMLLVAYLSERATRAGVARAAACSNLVGATADAALDGAETVRALGMRRGMIGRWREERRDYLDATSSSGRHAAFYASLAKFLRLALQSGALGLGAYLAVSREITPGAMIAGSILVGRALAPLDLVFGVWRSAASARQAIARIADVLQTTPPAEAAPGLGLSNARVQVDNVVVTAPNRNEAVLKQVSLSIAPGEFVCLVGPSGAGKSTLAKTIVGTWPARSGVVRFNGADVSLLDDDSRGRHVGYLPQDVRLYPGTIGDNISRFERWIEGANRRVIEVDVVEAAKAAGAHDVITDLPDGYDTEVGGPAMTLSCGQRQLIALARALYRRPPLLVLDEPNAHLDSEGERALLGAMADCKRRGCSIVLIAHRSLLVSQADSLVVLRDGMVIESGRRDDVLRRLGAAPAAVIGSTNAA